MKNSIQRMLTESLGGIVRHMKVARLADESGSTLVELALGTMLCMTLVLGAAEFGRLAYAGIEIENAAHAGAQFGSQNHIYASNSTAMQNAALQDAADVSGMSAQAWHFCKCSDGSVSTCSATDCSTSRVIEYVQVNTTASVNPKIYVPGLPTRYTLNGSAVMRVVQ